jgi:prefoldin alpha subunit
MSEEQSAEDRVNSLAVEVRILESTFNELTARQNLLERALMENKAALEALKEIGERKPVEVLLQIGGGALVRCAPPAVDKVLVNVGSNVIIEKSKDDALVLLEARAKQAEQTIISIIGQRNEIAERLETDKQVLQVLLSPSRKS